MERLPHGYTNRTRLVERGIEKSYVGVDSFARANREFAALEALLGHYPVSEVLEFDATRPLLIVREVHGSHGQDLIEQGRAAEVLRAVGLQLSRLQSLNPSAVPGLTGTGDVIVHGDFGPQNMLFDIDPIATTAVLDWEQAHIGSAVEDAAWAEWIIRTHHPNAVDYLPELFGALGRSFNWSERLDAMIHQCRDYIAFCELSGFDASAEVWKRRLEATSHWSE